MTAVPTNPNSCHFTAPCPCCGLLCTWTATDRGSTSHCPCTPTTTTTETR